MHKPRPRPRKQTDAEIVAAAIDRASENISKWLSHIDNALKDGLAAIALAASTPSDNSGEIKEKLKALTDRVGVQVDALKGAAEEP